MTERRVSDRKDVSRAFSLKLVRFGGKTQEGGGRKEVFGKTTIGGDQETLCWEEGRCVAEEQAKNIKYKKK